MDAKIVQVALSGLENILECGANNARNSNDPNNNLYANKVEECYGLDKIEFLQSHENMEIYKKAFYIIEKYFGSEENDTDKLIAPSSRSESFQFDMMGEIPGQFAF